MRRLESTVKSNVTRHSWHTASPPRKTSSLPLSQDTTPRGRMPEYFHRREKGDMHRPDHTVPPILYSTRLSLLCKQSSRRLFTRRRPDTSPRLRLSILCNQFRKRVSCPRSFPTWRLHGDRCEKFERGRDQGDREVCE